MFSKRLLTLQSKKLSSPLKFFSPTQIFKIPQISFTMPFKNFTTTNTSSSTNNTLNELTKQYGKVSIEVASYLEKESETLSKSGDIPNGLKYAREARNIYKELGMAANECSLLLFISNNYMKMKQLPLAVDALMEFAELRKKIYGEHDEKQAIAYYRIGSIYYQDGLFAQALETLEKARDIALKTEAGLKNLHLLEYRLGLCYYQLKRFEEALPLAKKAWHYFEGINDIKGLYGAEQFIGMSYEGLNDDKHALIHFKKSLQFANEAFGPDSHEVALSNYYLGKTEYRLGNYPLALEYSNNALHAFEKLSKDSIDVADTCYNIGLIYYKKEDCEASVYYLQRAIAIYLNNGKADSLKTVLAIESQTLALIKCGRGNEALDDMYKGLEILKEIPTISFELARLYFDTAKVFSEFFPEKVSDALKCAEAAKNVSDQIPGCSLSKDINALITKLKK